MRFGRWTEGEAVVMLTERERIWVRKIPYKGSLGCGEIVECRVGRTGETKGNLH